MNVAADDGTDHDVFAIPDFWRAPKLLDSNPSQGGSSHSFFGLSVEADDTVLDDHKVFSALQSGGDDDGFFKPPPFLDLPSDDVTPSAISEPESAQESQASSVHDDEDPWLSLSDDVRSIPSLRTWENFTAGGGQDPSTSSDSPLFITEAGPVAYDQFLASGAIRSKVLSAPDHRVISTHAYIGCHLALALGRASLLFSWDPSRRSFKQTLKHVKLSGYSIEILQGVSAVCLECGNNTRLLRGFVDKTYNAGNATPSRIALANALDRLFNKIQSELDRRGRSIRSLVQLQALVRPVASVSAYLVNLVAGLAKSKTDEALLSSLFHEAHTAEYAGSFLRDVLREFLKAVSVPWVEFVEEWVGLQPEKGIRLTKSGPGRGFVRVANRLETEGADYVLDEPDFLFDEDKMPSFVPEDIAQPLFETGRNLRFIWSYHPDHPLSHAQTVASSQPPRLEWQFEWDSITRVEQKALAFERSLVESLQAAATNQSKSLDGRQVQRTTDGKPQTTPQTAAPDPGTVFQFFGQGEDVIEERVLASMTRMSQPVLGPSAGADDSLGAIVQERLFQDGDSTTSDSADLAPHWSLVPLLSFGPVILAQARLVNRECMRLMFGAHQLREHLRVQRDFQLLGNGLFCSRLSHALFDPDLDTAEWQRGVSLSGGAMGLRLNGRDNWPPASSELRLALAGVLADSHTDSRPSASAAPGGGPPAARRRRLGGFGQQQLPGDLSFAIRELTVEEMDKCMNPDSLQALDFLRLSYKAPAPLTPVITPIILAKYDCVFKLLLRVLRMLFVANQLFRGTALATGTADSEDARRFRFEAHHFITCVATYFFDTGIGVPWHRFEDWLDCLETNITSESSNVDSAGSETATGGQIGGAGSDLSLEKLRERHEEVLDEIMLSLLLRKRQQPVLKLLEDIFSVILRFAKQVRQSKGAEEGEDEVHSQYREFRKMVDVFLTVCRGLSEKGAYGKRRDRGGGSKSSTIDLLVLALDMSGYYSRVVRP